MVRSAARTIIVPLDTGGIEAAESTLASLFEQWTGGRRSASPGRPRGRPSSTCATRARSTRWPSRSRSRPEVLPSRPTNRPPLRDRLPAELRTLIRGRRDDRVGPCDRAHGAPPSGRPVGEARGDLATTSARAYSFASDAWLDFSVIDRDSRALGAELSGPSIVLEKTATTYLDKAGMEGVVHESGALVVDTNL